MLVKVEQWIDQINDEYKEQRVCCNKFTQEFEGFYSTLFLEQSYYVIVPKLPKPDFPELRKAGLGGFIDMEVDGITYKNTYYILPHVANDLRLHFHELVHVAQWSQLGALEFMQRYIDGIQSYEKYEETPLEKIAYAFDKHFSEKGRKIDVINYLSQKI